MGLPCITSRLWRGGSLAANSGGSVPAASITDQDILDMNPVWWLDPDAAYCFTDDGSNAVTSDGDAVYAWHDRSGNTRHFGETYSAYRPLWRASGENSKPYVDYTASASRLYNNPASSFTGSDIGAHAAPMTQYMVVAAVTSATQHGKVLATASSNFRYGNTGTGYPSSIYTTFGSNGTVIWGDQSPAPQSLTTQIIQVECAGDSLPVLRINGGSGATRTTTASAAEDNWTSASSTTMFWGYWGGATFLSYDYLAFGDVTHNADTVLEYLGNKYNITVEAVS